MTQQTSNATERPCGTTQRHVVFIDGVYDGTHVYETTTWIAG